LEGSLRLRTLREVGHSHGLDFPDTQKLRELVQISEEEEFTFENFLSKFQTLRLFYRSPEVIERLTRETIEDAANDNVRYLELRFTPVALGRAEDFDLGSVIDWVIQGALKAQEEFGVKTRLIASVNRHESPELAMQVTNLAIERINDGIVGIDLAGNEADFSGAVFLAAFKKARNAGLHITVHAGEWGPAENVSDAILYMNAERIGHGIRVLDDPNVTALARDREVSFEVCVTSNYQSGVVPNLQVHPLPRMLEQGLNVTINSDDPSISQIKLSDEYKLVVENLGLSMTSLQDRVIAAAQASFLPDKEKFELVNQIESEYKQELEKLS
jgi:adenosine deaminase